MKLILLLPYINAGGRQLQPGQMLEVDAAETQRLLNEKIAEEFKTSAKPVKKQTKRKSSKNK